MYEKSIELLNKAVADEMSAVHQYMYFHSRCDDQGYDPLAAVFKRTAMNEMIHTEILAERILFNFETQPDHLDRFGEQFLALQSIERSKSMAAQQGGAE